MAEVTLQDVTKKFGDVTAVSNLNLSVGDGEFMVLLGPTGSGKTTTLRLVAGLETPEQGAIHIAGRDVTRAAPAQRDIAMVFQEYSLYPHFSVYDNLAFPLRSPLRRMPEDKIKKRVHELAELLHIEHKLKNKGTALSGGEMQRVAIGRALVREPAAFLMDEPLSSLDAKLREELRVELKRIQVDLGATIIYVTHDQIEAMTMADRIGVLAEGELLQVGTPEEIYRRPANSYVSCRLGSPGINLIDKDLVADLAQGATLGLGTIPDNARTLGIRPENIALGEGGARSHIQSIEHLGTETVVHLKLNGLELAALAPTGAGFSEGQEVELTLLPDTTLFFDKVGDRLA